VSNSRLEPGKGPTESYNDKHLEELSAGPSGISEGAPEGLFLGTYFRPDAPLRAKITPPHEPGVVMVINGQIWGNDTREPIARAKMDVWQANAKGQYDNEGDAYDPESTLFINRARLYSDQNGYYEFETVHPGGYQRRGTEGLFWRAPHIHFRVRCPGYQPLVTELFFTGDPHHESDPFLRESLVIKLTIKQRNGRSYEEGIFDIVLTPQTQNGIE
jgi:catechol 1,2-dioxygenase